jgi:anaerobic selenocysteine-containing dehydrogenase
MKKVLTACTADCPGACSIIAHVKGGEVVRLEGNPEHDYTHGFLCKNTRRYLDEHQYSSKRILHPLIRRNDDWMRISWQEALEIVSNKISQVIGEYGSSSILYYQGFGSRTALKILNRRFFNLLGGVTTLNGTLCGGIGQSGQEMDMGVRISHDPLDHLNSNFIILWGRNPAVTDVHLWRIIRKAQRSGVEVVVIDPVKTKTAQKADLFIQPRPGSDHYLAMALAKIILNENLVDHKFIAKHTKNFPEYVQILDKHDLNILSNFCDVPIPDLELLAYKYAQNKPSSIIMGWGLHRYHNGHLFSRFIDALSALTGNIGISGGGVSHGFEEYGFFDTSLCGKGQNQRELPMPTIGEAILNTNDPPIKLIMVSSGNPVTLSPHSEKVKRAFESADFVVIIDHFLNDTSDVADLFLPSTTFLEEKTLLVVMVMAGYHP